MQPVKFVQQLTGQPWSTIFRIVAAFLENSRHDEGILLWTVEASFKDIFPELSNSVSPPAEPGVYSGEIIGWEVSHLYWHRGVEVHHKARENRRCSWFPSCLSSLDSTAFRISVAWAHSFIFLRDYWCATNIAQKQVTLIIVFLLVYYSWLFSEFHLDWESN